MYVACEGLSDLGNGPNKPTATIIGEYSTSLQDGALIYPLAPSRKFEDLTQIWQALQQSFGEYSASDFSYLS